MVRRQCRGGLGIEILEFRNCNPSPLAKFHDVEIPSFLQKSWNREFEAQTRKLGIVILALLLSFCPPLLRIPKFPIPIPAPSAPCKPRIPKFPIPLPAPSAPCKPRIPRFPIPLPAPSAPCKPRIPKFLIPLPAPSALCKPRIPSVPNSTFRRPPAVLASFLQTRYTLANSQIPKSNPGPKAPKAKRFRIPRVQRLKLHFPPCNHAQPHP